MRMEVGGLLGLIVLVADIWAIVHVLGSSSWTGTKVLWTVLILIFPVLGFLIWLLFGPRGGWRRSARGRSASHCAICRRRQMRSTPAWCGTVGSTTTRRWSGCAG